jgi:hypothetical protein
MKYAKKRVSNPIATRIAFLFLITKEAYLAARFFMFIYLNNKKVQVFRIPGLFK